MKDDDHGIAETSQLRRHRVSATAVQHVGWAHCGYILDLENNDIRQTVLGIMTLGITNNDIYVNRVQLCPKYDTLKVVIAILVNILISTANLTSSVIRNTCSHNIYGNTFGLKTSFKMNIFLSLHV